MGRHLAVPPNYYNLMNIYNFGLKIKKVSQNKYMVMLDLYYFKC